jgi:hypothetical protein
MKGRLTTMDGLMDLKDRLSTGWSAMPKTLPAALTTLAGKVEAKPDQSATIEAQTFLTTAQLRLNDYREAMPKSAECGDRAARRWAIRSRWPNKAPSVRLPLPCRRSLVRVHRMETPGRRGTKVRNSSHRLTAWKCLQAAEYVCVTCLASPCRAGGSRSRPQAGGAGAREQREP